MLHAERQVDGQTDMAKPVVAFHNYVANMPINSGYTKFIQKIVCQDGRHNDVLLRLF